MEKFWQTSKRAINYGEKTLVMAILNVTPDSFSDGGKFAAVDAALRQAEKLVAEGADILDIGGESTRPNAQRVEANEETRRVVPIIEAIVKRFDVAVSIDTSKSSVAENAINAGAEIINDISGLRFDERVAEIAAEYKTGLVLMHLRGTFETMHKIIPVENIFDELSQSFRQSIEKARGYGVKNEQIALDVGIGFSKTFEQNLELIAKLDKLVAESPEFPIIVGASRKSFVGKILGNDVPPLERINGSLAGAAIAVWNGANIVRVHDVKATVETIKVVEAIKTKV
jgi:dihydropteroate synthase